MVTFSYETNIFYHVFISSSISNTRNRPLPVGWQEFRCESHWDNIGTFTAPIGEMKNCFKKTRNVGYTHIEIFCDQVGLVHEQMRDQGGNGYDRWLVKKNF